MRNLIPTTTQDFPQDDEAVARTGTIRIRAEYPEPPGAQDVARLWDVVRPGHLGLDGRCITINGETTTNDGNETTNDGSETGARGFADRLVDALPDNPGFIEVTWSTGYPQCYHPGVQQTSGDDPPF